MCTASLAFQGLRCDIGAAWCTGVHVTSVKFDYSGQYLAVGGQDARVYGVKQDWGLLATMSDLPKKVCMPASTFDWQYLPTHVINVPVGWTDHSIVTQQILGWPSC